MKKILIGGCDRSGTTLLGDVLGGLDGAVVGPESHFLHESIRLSQYGFFQGTEDAMSWLVQNPWFSIWFPDGCTALREISEKLLSQDINGYLEQVVSAYALRIGRGSTVRVWVDHTPNNTRHIGLYDNVFQNVIFVHIVRDGRAVYASFKKLPWGPSSPFGVAKYWSDRVEYGLMNELVLKKRSCRVRFEDLVSEPEEVVNKLFEQLQLPRNSTNSLSVGNIELPFFTRKQHALVGSVPKKSRAEAWRTELTKRELLGFESARMARPLLSYLGYVPLTNGKASEARLALYLLRDLIGQVQEKVFMRKMVKSLNAQTKGRKQDSLDTN